MLSGCVVGPNYVEPTTAVDDRFAADAATFAAAEPAARWWLSFEDPVLTGLVADAVAANYDLRAAEANLRQARALLIEARYELLPIVPASAGYERDHFSRANQLGPRRDRDLYTAGFDATWELDVFGGVRRSIEARGAEVGAAEARRLDLRVSVIAEVARNYMELRGAQGGLTVARGNAENQRRTYDLTTRLLAGGRGTDLDTARAKSQLETTLATIPALESSVEQSAYRIAVLTGRQPAALVGLLAPAAPLPPAPPQIAIGDPGALIRRRPDVRAAERTLAAATARIGVQTADLYPRVDFVGSIGVEATRLAGFGRGGDAYAFGPRLTWAAFDLGRVQARILAADAAADAALADFHQTVLAALEDVQRSLISYSKQRERLEHLGAAEVSARQASDLARQRYEAGGIGDFLTVLDAERRTLETQQALSDGRTQVATALVAVYKALSAGSGTSENPGSSRAANRVRTPDGTGAATVREPGAVAVPPPAP